MRRDTLTYKLKKGLTQPKRIFPFIKRAWRNYHLKRSSQNFLDFYSRVVDNDAMLKNPDYAIGSNNQEHWAETGKMQFDYLIKHGLQPTHRVLDIGCGNLRLGIHLIKYLDSGNYVGLDISPAIIQSAQKKIAEFDLTKKLPYIHLVKETDYGFLPERYFDFVHAHSVFSHLPLNEIRKVLVNAKRLMKPNAFFDFTYFSAKNRNSNFLHEDFYYNTNLLLDLGKELGFEATKMEDWNYIQDKIRLIKPS